MAKQSREDLERLLREQLEFIKASAQRYDAGHSAEAKRLALHVRVLVHDTRSSRSLLGQLDMKGRPFLDTASERDQGVRTSYSGLVGMSLNTGASIYVPNLDVMDHRRVPFDDWWNAPIIIDTNQREVSRKRLVLAVANQDGGAHVDPELDDIYADLLKSKSMGRMYSTGSAWEPIHGVAHTSVRQVAHEVMQTLNEPYPQPRGMTPRIAIHGMRVQVTPVYGGAAAKVGRNERCPCGSGKKYKRCHGAA